MRALGIFFLLSWAMLATGFAWFEREQAQAVAVQRDRALAACSAAE